jgi:hypothetical protein
MTPQISSHSIKTENINNVNSKDYIKTNNLDIYDDMPELESDS